MPALVEARLYSNKIHTIQQSAFYDSPNLSNINLKANKLVTLSINMFNPSKRIQSLSIKSALNSNRGSAYIKQSLYTGYFTI